MYKIISALLLFIVLADLVLYCLNAKFDVQDYMENISMAEAMHFDEVIDNIRAQTWEITGDWGVVDGIRTFINQLLAGTKGIVTAIVFFANGVWSILGYVAAFLATLIYVN